MGIEGMHSISSYQGQGSSTGNTSAPKTAPKAEVKTENSQVTIDSAPEISGAMSREEADGKSYRELGQASNEQIRKAVEKINKNAQSHGEAVFGIHDETNRVTIKIVDKETKEVIKEFPPEKTLDMIAKVWEMAGIMVDERR